MHSQVLKDTAHWVVEATQQLTHSVVGAQCPVLDVVEEWGEGRGGLALITFVCLKDACAVNTLSSASIGCSPVMVVFKGGGGDGRPF